MRSITLAIITMTHATVAFAEEQILSTSPSCQTGDFYCTTEDFYARPVALSESETGQVRHGWALKAYEERTRDGVVTLDEIVAQGTAPFDREYWTQVMRETWLLANGYDVNLPGDTIIPQGSLTHAGPSRHAPALPNVAPACEGDPKPSACMTVSINMSELADIPGVALREFIIWRDIPNFDEWLSRNGLQGSGVTLYSIVPSGEYTLRLVN